MPKNALFARGGSKHCNSSPMLDGPVGYVVDPRSFGPNVPKSRNVAINLELLT